VLKLLVIRQCSFSEAIDAVYQLANSRTSNLPFFEAHLNRITNLQSEREKKSIIYLKPSGKSRHTLWGPPGPTVFAKIRLALNFAMAVLIGLKS
jgi:hypothetical protein